MKTGDREKNSAGGTPKRGSVPLYAGAFALFFLLFFLLGFPRDSVERRMIYEIQSRSPVPVTVGSASLRGISSVEVKDVRVALREPVVIDSARAGAGLFSLVFSDEKKISFSVKAYGGEIAGQVVADAGRGAVSSADVNIKDLESSQLSGAFLGNTGVSLGGKLDGTVTFRGEDQSGGISGLEYRITSPAFSVSLDAKVRGFQVNEEYSGLAAELSGTASRFESNIEKLSLSSQELSLLVAGKGPSPLRPRKEAELDLSVTLRPSPEDPKLVLLGSFLGSRGGGEYSGKIRGTLRKPVLVRGGSGGS